MSPYLRGGLHLASAVGWVAGTVTAESYGLLSQDATVAIGMLGMAIIIGHGIWLENLPPKTGGK
jgi:hypothetical protein